MSLKIHNNNLSFSEMESAIDTVLESLIKTEGVKGVLVADAHGLCIGARGIANPNCAGFVTAIATHAKALSDDPNSQAPTTKIEADNS
ncbi:13352_t:CDS:2 [Dentiscutata heterogama]|uniref:13352_t:CDS:1 n=1 Tax=Dentiscutata heterogama TaxID=1316150 RepID=A0ACA9M624_9GLOM|nr:13352_t:CDS:2 [Dentiscutata heterogama]